jgi:hypothetical protein
MNSRITLHLTIIGLLAFYIAGCANVKDLQPPPSDTLPDSVLTVFQKEVPNAKNVVFKTVEENWLYEVNYTLEDHPAYGLLDNKKLLANYWRKTDTFPDSLRKMVDQLVIKNGVTSGFWEPVFQYPYYKIYYTNFDFEGRQYVMSIQHFIDKDTGYKSYSIEFGPKWRFNVNAINDEKRLPEQIGAALKARNIKLQTSSMAIDENGKRTYYVNANDTNFRSYTFTFNNEAKMIFAFDNVPENLFSLDQFPTPIQDFVKASPFRDFEFIQGNAFSDPEVSGHIVVVSSEKNGQSFRNIFDQNGALVKMSFHASFN